MKFLLTILNGGLDSERVLKSAVTLKKALGARLLVAHPRAPLPGAAVMAGDMGVALGAIEFTESEYSVEQARKAFELVCANDPTCRFRETQMTPHETLRKFTLFSDLVVLARDEGLGDASVVQLKDSLVTNEMPTVWLPPETVAASPGTVVCVWNGQAPSARAIRAAQPFLTRAERIIVIEYAGNEVNHSRLEKYLDAYGLKVSAWRPYGDSGLSARARARALMAEAKSAGADLLVMGAYGEMVESFFSFGRATEKVAEAATVPVLFHN